MTRITVNRLLSSICDLENCIESGKINYDSLLPDSIHFRIDGKAITDNSINKCDCLIIYCPSTTDHSYILLIELKKTNPDKTDFLKQLQSCYDKYHELLDDLLENSPTNDDILHMLPAVHRDKKAFQKLLLRIINHISKTKVTILPILCADRNISRMKRSGYTMSFRLRNKQRIIPIQSGQDLLSLIS